MAETSIEWTDRTWNPVRGCSRISEGCRHCYAERQAARFSDPGQYAHGFVERTKSGPRWTGKVELVEEKLREPLRWRKPQRVFVNSMSDLFHESLPDEAIDRVFAVMLAAPQHTFQILTKRPERMRKYMDASYVPGGILVAQNGLVLQGEADPQTWPPKNVWLGVSVEDQKTAGERIPLLIETPAAVRFISAEPLLGPVNLSRWMWPVHQSWPAGFDSPAAARAAGVKLDPPHRQCLVAAGSVFLDWVIVGGESGPGARACDIGWIRRIVGQCKPAGTACFVKQLGANPAPISVEECGRVVERLWLDDRKGGDPSEWPEDLRVREFPTAHQAHSRA